jgi:ribokinase
MPAGRVVVVGSVNVDLVVATSRLPRPGETVIGGRFARYFGGKGANQAVAAARAGASVVFIGAVGNDADGDESLAALAAEGIDVSRVERVDAATGVAIIAVAADGENQIVVAPGANALLSSDAANMPDLPPGPGVVLTCLEIPMESVVTAVEAATRIGMQAIVNPAPAATLPDEVLAAGAILTPNEDELLTMSGAIDLDSGVRALIDAGARAVAVTMGASGALLAEGERRWTVPALLADVVDATGAGDTFSGVLAAWLARGSDLDAAVKAATCAAGLTVSRPGARGTPTRSAIEAALRV